MGNRQWPNHRTIAAEDMHQVTPVVLRSLVDEAGADDWFVVPLPVTGDGSPDRPFMLVDPETAGH
ncbi:hypothetical protein ACIOFV_07560 [Streptomyces mirabilis]|uniref:hypothetical protein n=1 Tax=Streptomyces mirabilis TaxID=68239 RepID=UPI0037F1A1F7